MRHGIQSIEVGMRLLDAQAAAASEITLGTLARAAGMHPAKAHRYLTSLIRAGYITQNPATGRYGLGASSTSLGLAALRQLDVVRLGDDIIGDLREATGQTISMVVWANRGPTIVRVSESDTMILVTVRIGSVLPLLTSANGQIFLAYLPRVKTGQLIDSELAIVRGGDGKTLRTMADVERRIVEVRNRGIARNNQSVVIGVVSLAAPVFDHRGEIACSIALVGSLGNLHLALNGEPARALGAAAARLSERLGAARPQKE
jgi:DNA-binding IclR family transcriptional regulator